MNEKIKILLFEDNPGDAYLIEEMLEEFADFPYELEKVETLNEGLSLLKEHTFNVILTDLGLPDSDGIDTFLSIRVRNERIPTIILTGSEDERIGIDAARTGAQDYLVKGQVDGRLLKRSIQYSIERKKADDALEKIEKIRIKEIHHRIKNNLQIISSLLDLQAEKFEDEKVKKGFKEGQDRVISIALIHEELYKGEGTDKLDFSAYLQKLTKTLFQTYSLSSKNIHLCMDLEENLFFDMDTAVPLGIIVNELVSNSLKHAFLGRDQGEIQIKFHREEGKNEGCDDTNFILTVSDNGIGITEDLDIEDLDSLGIQLVTTLVDQLDGEHELKRNNGTEFTIKFKVTEQYNQVSAPALQQLIE